MTILKVFKPEELDIAAAVEAIYRLLLVSATYGDSVKSRRRVGMPQCCMIRSIWQSLME